MARNVPGRGMRFWYAGIRVRNLNRSLDIYKNAIGMKEVRRGTMSHGGTYVGLRFPGSETELELNYLPEGEPVCEEIHEGRGAGPLWFRRQGPGRHLDRTMPRLKMNPRTS